MSDDSLNSSNSSSGLTAPISDISTEKVSVIVLTGDLAGFSSSYASGNALIVEEFIRRFYLLCSAVISAADGKLVKFTGDGFFAVWSLSNDFRNNSKLCWLVEAVAITLSAFVKITRLDLAIDTRIILKQGITIEPNAIQINYSREFREMDNDFLGKMINFAFRIQAVPKAYPHIAIHKDFLDLIQMYLKEPLPHYANQPVSDDMIMKLFKGVRDNTEKIFVFGFIDESKIDSIISDLRDKSLSEDDTLVGVGVIDKIYESSIKDENYTLVGKFNKNLGIICSNGPDWLKRSDELRTKFLIRWAMTIHENEKKVAALKSEMERLKNAEAKLLKEGNQELPGESDDNLQDN